MRSHGLAYAALTCPWAGGLQVFVLSPTDGLVGETVASGPDEVKAQSRKVLVSSLGRAADDVLIETVRR